MTINFNPNLPPNDSLEPWEIEAKVAARNAETRHLTEKAWLTGGVPPSAAERAADHASNARQTPEAKKARRDARTSWGAKNVGSGDCDE
jgi:hypothetical protein